jgi:DNA-directed RNA polymerase specialized sigma24 family protein
LALLSKTDQLMIRLRDYEDLSYDAIATLLEVEAAACRQRHSRALRRLRDLIEADKELAVLLLMKGITDDNPS